MKIKFQNELKTVKENIVDSTLYYGAVMGLVIFFLSYGTKIVAGYFPFQLFTDLLAISGVTLVAVFRKKIPFTLKAYFLLLIFYLLISVEILRLGVISENNVLMILIPFVSLIALSKKQFWMVNALTVVAYSVVAYFFITEKIPSEFSLYNTSVTNWISRLAMLSIVAFVVLIIFNQFNKKYLQIISELSRGNDLLKKNELELNVYKEHLEDLVNKRTEELTAKVEELRKTQLQLVQSEKMASLGILSAGVGHEINNPLNFIANGFEGVKNELNGKVHSSEITAYIMAVDEGIKRISRIVKGLSQYSRPDDGLMEKCNVKEIVENCLLLLNKQLILRVDVTQNFPETIPLISGNASELHQVIGNVIYNAIEAIKKDGTLEIKGVLKEQHLLLSFKDSGTGIKKEHLAKVLDPFFTTKPAGSGTGLGLAICAQILKKQGGEIKIDSEYGKGTTVTISFAVA